MKKWIVRKTLCLAVVVSCAAVIPIAVASDEGQAAADQVSATSYQNFLNNYLYTHTGQSRGPSGAQHDPARDNIRTLFQSYGLTTAFETFTYNSNTWENVVATKTGTTYPSRIYIIGGHYDSASTPGADDNASGVALVLEAARILSQYPSDCTIRFIAFDMEEAGLIGSDRYASAHASEDIRGMISLDMVAYDPSTNHALIYGRTASNPIKNTLAAAITEYSGLTYTINGQLDQSDHASFESRGFQACLLIEGEVWNNPYYHTANDKYESTNYLNFPYAAQMTRSVVGWLVDQAGVHVPVNKLAFDYPDGQPEYVDPAGGTHLRVVVTGVGTEVPQPGTGVFYYNTGAAWHSAPMTVVADNVYDAVFPATTCGTAVSYYVSAQAAGGQIFTDPSGAPAIADTATAGFGVDAFYSNTLDTNPGWTTQGLWAFGHPTGGGGQYGEPDPTSGHTGANVYGYNLSGDYENNLAERNLTSTSIDCTGRYHVRLSFWRWLGVEQPLYDHAYVRVSNNGSTWTTIWQNDAEVADTAWQAMDFDVSAIADNQPTVYLRWTMGTTDSGWQYCGWNIDDIALTSLRCEPPMILGDMNCDGVVNNQDIDHFVQALFYPAQYAADHDGDPYAPCEILRGDFTGDGLLNNQDIDGFVAALFS